MNYHDKVRQDAERAVYLLSEEGVDCRLEEDLDSVNLLITLSSGRTIRLGCDIYEQLVFEIEE